MQAHDYRTNNETNTYFRSVYERLLHKHSKLTTVEVEALHRCKGLKLTRPLLSIYKYNSRYGAE